MARLSKLEKVSDSFTINRYDNGWMIEVSGRDDNDDWKIAKIICNSEDELVDVIKEYNTKPLEG